ncbi:MAG: hypothetical protein HY326_13520 [Chloroflexi bacterium]|nr:hypothetical protein [Chloroflexota bacterium]
MTELKLPEELDGPWEHALILSYGLDLPFFESTLWRQFKGSCRNKIILPDGRMYLEALSDYARDRQVRYVNQLYIAEGIFVPQAAHAKLILLVNPEQGRLLVGSGNLSWQGYASGGELFTSYSYAVEKPLELPAFVAVRELLEGLTSRGYISIPAQRQVRYLFEQTPWLFQTPSSNGRPVRHNLETSFLAQLQAEVSNHAVEELWILSPFYDEELIALEHMLEALHPDHVHLLVQAGQTSIKPAALQKLVESFPGRWNIHPFNKEDYRPYVHAKLYLLKLPNGAICLQGSPNLSQVAMLWSVPRGNIELANLLTGPRDAFNNLLKVLNILPEVSNLADLEVSYQPSTPSISQLSQGWYLTGGEWVENRLFLNFRGTLTELEVASVVIDKQQFDLRVIRQEYGILELLLSLEAASLLGQAIPLYLTVAQDGEIVTSNPIYLCNRAALKKVLETQEGDGVIEKIGDLELNDEELERLLGELDASLIIDRQSVWHMAGRTPPPGTEDDDEALRLDYADIDYNMLRKHPKMQPYVRKKSGGGGDYVPTRLQIILNAITSYFNQIIDKASGVPVPPELSANLDNAEAETEEESDKDAAEKTKRHLSMRQRTQRILKNFVQRYLRGIRSPDFQSFAGFEVMGQNYPIFNHLLWMLLKKEWVDTEFVVDALMQSFQLFWGQAGGNQTRKGYFWTLPQEQATQVLQWVKEYHADERFLAALYYCAYFTRVEKREALRFALRDFWREFLSFPPFEITEEVIEGAWKLEPDLNAYQPPRPPTIVDELAQLAHFETKGNFLRTLEEAYSFPLFSCKLEKQKVRRPATGQDEVVECLELGVAEVLANIDAALSLLRLWMRCEERDYYRISNRATGRVIFYERRNQQGIYWAKDQGSAPVDLDHVMPIPTEWEKMPSLLQRLAAQVDARNTIPQIVSTAIPVIRKTD